MNIQIKRVYDAPQKSDGARVLVDGIWPRGMSKERAHVDRWSKEIAPSKDLRKWFGHDPERWEQFKARYFEQLEDHDEELDELMETARGKRTLTLLYAARDREHNNAVALKDYLQHKAGRNKT